MKALAKAKVRVVPRPTSRLPTIPLGSAEGDDHAPLLSSAVEEEAAVIAAAYTAPPPAMLLQAAPREQPAGPVAASTL